MRSIFRRLRSIFPLSEAAQVQLQFFALLTIVLLFAIEARSVRPCRCAQPAAAKSEGK